MKQVITAQHTDSLSGYTEYRNGQWGISPEQFNGEGNSQRESAMLGLN